jgi:hypothetical protein
LLLRLQIRAVDDESLLPGPPDSWRWTVKACEGEERYAVIGARGDITCKACPSGGDCAEDDTVLHSILALPGWWWPPQDTLAQRRQRDTATFYPCPLEGSCIGGNRTGQCDADKGFAEDSLLCSACAPGFARKIASCVACGTLLFVLAKVAFGGSFSVGYIVYKVHKQLHHDFVAPGADMALLVRKRAARKMRSVIQRIGISHVTTLSTIGNMAVDGPEILREVFGFFNAFASGMSTSSAAVRCATGFGFYQEVSRLAQPCRAACSGAVCCALAWCRW